MEADLGFFGTGLQADPVQKVNSTEVSFVRDKQNLCSGLKRDCSMVRCLEGAWETWSYVDWIWP